MESKQIQELISRKPFRAFRITLSSGDHLSILEEGDICNNRRRPELYVIFTEDGLTHLIEAGDIVTISFLYNSKKTSAATSIPLEPEQDNNLLTIGEVAKRLHVSIPTIRRMLGSKLPCIQISRKNIRIKEADVQKFIKSRRVGIFADEPNSPAMSARFRGNLRN